MPGSEQPGIDVIVVNYRTPECLARFLDSYFENPPTAASLIVYNVDPEEMDRKVAGQYDCRYIESSKNVGYNIAVNGAAACGDREVIGIFNSDVVLSPGAIDDCREALLSDPKWAVLGPRQVDASGMITHAGMFGTNDNTRPRGWREYDQNQYNEVRDDAVTLSGAALFFRRSVWNELTGCGRFQQCNPGALGAFLPVSHYYGETYANYHARAHGYKCVYWGPVQIRHDWHQSSPVGGWAESCMHDDQESFRAACAAHGILCD